MSVIIKGKNPRKPHTVRYWADGRQRERSFATAREATDFKIKTDHDTRAQIFVDDKLGREDTEVIEEGCEILGVVFRKRHERPEGLASLLNRCRVQRFTMHGVAENPARSPAMWPPTRSPMTLRLPAGSGCWPIISSW